MGSCPGDSGGPLMRYRTHTRDPAYLQVGVVSGGVGRCGDENFPGVYVRVDDPRVLRFVRDGLRNETRMEEEEEEDDEEEEVHTVEGESHNRVTSDPDDDEEEAFCFVIGQCKRSFYLDGVSSKSPEDCLQRCKDTEGCRYFTHFGDQVGQIRFNDL